MKRDHSPVLPGEGATDYARYMRTDALLSLQRDPKEMIHRDELLFQVVHQSTELWLKLAVAEVTDAATHVADGELAEARLLLARAALAIRLVTDQLDMFQHLPPATFQALIPVLGNGSGAESPGWKQAQAASRRLDQAFRAYCTDRQIDLRKVYAGSAADPVYQLAEAMVDWDERIVLWRVRHYKIAIRVGSHGPIGTKDSPANWLAKLIDHRFFADLWRVRTELVGER